MSAVLMNLTQGQMTDVVKRIGINQSADPIENRVLSSGIGKTIAKSQNSGDIEILQEDTDVSLYGYVTKSESVDAREAEVVVGYKKIIGIEEINHQITVSYRFRKTANNANYDIFRRKLFNLGNIVPATIDLRLSNMLTYGNQTGFTSSSGETVDTTTADGLPAWHYAHTLTGSPKTYRTIAFGNPVFSDTGMEQMANHFHYGIYDNLGQAVTMMPDTICITMNEAVQREAFKYMKSSAEPTAPNSNVVNYWQSRYEIVTLPRLGLRPDGKTWDASRFNMWIMASRKDMGNALVNVEFAPTEISNGTSGNNTEDIDNGDWKYTLRSLQGFGFVSTKGMIVSFGTQATLPGDLVYSF